MRNRQAAHSPLTQSTSRDPLLSEPLRSSAPCKPPACASRGPNQGPIRGGQHILMHCSEVTRNDSLLWAYPHMQPSLPITVKVGPIEITGSGMFLVRNFCAPLSLNATFLLSMDFEGTATRASEFFSGVNVSRGLVCLNRLLGTATGVKSSAMRRGVEGRCGDITRATSM